jgi:hypothetical protein
VRPAGLQPAEYVAQVSQLRAIAHGKLENLPHVSGVKLLWRTGENACVTISVDRTFWSAPKHRQSDFEFTQEIFKEYAIFPRNVIKITQGRLSVASSGMTSFLSIPIQIRCVPLHNRERPDIYPYGGETGYFKVNGWVAQLAEQRTENPRVGGSIPPPARPVFILLRHSGSVRKTCKFSIDTAICLK